MPTVVNMPPTGAVNGKGIILAGVATCLKNEKISIPVLYNGGALLVEFQFTSDNSGNMSAKDSSPQPGILLLELANWENPLGVSFQNRIQVGEVGGKKIELLFSINKSGSITVLFYTFTEA